MKKITFTENEIKELKQHYEDLLLETQKKIQEIQGILDQINGELSGAELSEGLAEGEKKVKSIVSKRKPTKSVSKSGLHGEAKPVTQRQPFNHAEVDWKTVDIREYILGVFDDMEFLYMETTMIDKVMMDLKISAYSYDMVKEKITEAFDALTQAGVLKTFLPKKAVDPYYGLSEWFDESGSPKMEYRKKLL